MAKLYYFVDAKSVIELYKEIVGDLSMDIDGVNRESVEGGALSSSSAYIPKDVLFD